MNATRVATWVLLVMAAAIGMRTSAARACAPAPEPGTYVSVTDEEALIVWDAERRVQHFVRRASFEGTSNAFGFLVPTPTRPELAEADDAVFTRLWAHTRPRVEHVRSYTPHTCCTFALGAFVMGASRDMETASAPASVTVLDSTRVAGMDATVLAATDAAALAQWLGRHGFERSAALEGWFAQYVRLGWILTAFRYAKSAAAPTVAGRAVRMSFRTERPFFPYREPDAASHASPGEQPERVLRVFLVGATRMDGSLGEAGAPWVATTDHARPLGDAASLLRGAVPEGAFTASSWLTQMTDVREVRPTDADVFFGPARQRAEVAPVTYVEDEVLLPIPVELVVPIVVVGWVLVRRRRKKRAAAKAGGVQA